MPILQRILTAVLLGAMVSTRAAVMIFDFSGVNTAIPDGDSTGLVNAQTITSAPGFSITDINVSLTLSGTGFGGYNGDIYATLQHDSGFVVLLNRVGKRSSSPQGYGDAGLQVTFDQASARDIHNYRLVLGGSEATPLGERSAALGRRTADEQTRTSSSIAAQRTRH